MHSLSPNLLQLPQCWFPDNLNLDRPDRQNRVKCLLCFSLCHAMIFLIERQIYMGGEEMNIIGNINKKLIFDKDEICAGGENDIEEVIRVTPVPLPEDYIEFLKQISGEDSYGPEFEVEDEGLSIWIWSAKMALEKSEEFNRPSNQKFMSNAWLFGNDLGDLVYFFGTGKDGFGLYRTSAGCLDLENDEKISDTLTDFLVHGVGIDIDTSL